MTVVFAAGALVVWAMSGLLRAGVTALAEPRGHRLDRWRRVWFHPERELGRLLEGLLVIAFVVSYVRRSGLPLWPAVVVAAVWGLDLPADFWNWFRWRRRPQRTRELHERGFLLLDLGPLWLRAVVLGLAGSLYLVPPLRAALDTMMGFILASLDRWLA